MHAILMIYEICEQLRTPVVTIKKGRSPGQVQPPYRIDSAILDTIRETGVGEKRV